MKPHREVSFNYIKTTFPCQHRCAHSPQVIFPCSLTCLSGLLGSIGGSGWSVQMRWWKGSRRGRCSRDRAPFTSPPLSRRASSHWDASLKPREWSSFICNTTGRDFKYEGCAHLGCQQLKPNTQTKDFRDTKHIGVNFRVFNMSEFKFKTVRNYPKSSFQRRLFTSAC